MEFKNTLINTALLGTDKKHLSLSDIPEPLHEATSSVLEQAIDKETQFLYIGALALNCYKTALTPPRLHLEPSVCAAETLPYCSLEAGQLLHELLASQLPILTRLWTQYCTDKAQIVPPQLLNPYFKWGVANKAHSLALFTQAIGKRGLWLAQFQEAWDFVNKPEESTIDWLTADTKTRVKHLQILRGQQPQEALALIQSVWKEENAATKQDFLDALATGLSSHDEPFLQSCLSDKSQKVKEKAYRLLKHIPQSMLLRSYEQILKDSITFTHTKTLGFISKKTIAIKVVVKDEEVFKTGIQKLSNDKRVSDDSHILLQLISEVHPNFWTQHFNSSPLEVLQLFAEKEELLLFQQALADVILKFKCSDWAVLAFEHLPKQHMELLQLLEDDKRLQYAETFLPQEFDQTINLIIEHSYHKEWPMSFAKVAVQEFAKNIYWNNKALCESMSLYLPKEILADIEKAEPKDDHRKSYWQTIQAEFTRNIHLKEKIKKAFS